MRSIARTRTRRRLDRSSTPLITSSLFAESSRRSAANSRTWKSLMLMNALLTWCKNSSVVWRLPQKSLKTSKPSWIKWAWTSIAIRLTQRGSSTKVQPVVPAAQARAQGKILSTHLWAWLAEVKLLKAVLLQVPLANLLVESQRKLHRELKAAHQ